MQFNLEYAGEVGTEGELGQLGWPNLLLEVTTVDMNLVVGIGGDLDSDGGSFGDLGSLHPTLGNAIHDVDGDAGAERRRRGGGCCCACGCRRDAGDP